MDALTYEVKFKLNGKDTAVAVDPRETLLDAVRDRLGLTGSKKGCDEAACGACSVLFNGEAVYSCTMLAVEASNAEIVTIEGISTDGNLSRIQDAFIECDAFQCGFCTSGQIVALASLIMNSRKPGDSEIRESLTGNICRCGAYVKIMEAARRTVSEVD